MKKLNLLCGFYVVTSRGEWGRGLMLNDAFRSAHCKPDEKRVKYSVTTFLFKEGTPDSVRQNIINCYFVDDWGNVKQCSPLSKEDTDEVDRYLVGWTSWSNQHLFEKKATKGQVDKAFKEARDNYGTTLENLKD